MGEERNSMAWSTARFQVKALAQAFNYCGWGQEGREQRHHERAGRRILICFPPFILTTEQPASFIIKHDDLRAWMRGPRIR